MSAAQQTTRETVREARARRAALAHAELEELGALASRGAIVVSVLALALTPWMIFWALLWRWLA